MELAPDVAMNSPHTSPAEDERLESLVRQGYAAHTAGRLDEAEQCYRQILQLQPDHCDALHLLGTVVLAAGDYEQAIGLQRRASAQRPAEAAFHRALAAALEVAGRGEEAIPSYEAVLALDSGDAQTSNNLGCLFRNRGDNRKARECFEAAVRVQPDMAEAQYNLANILCELGDRAGAIAHFHAALKAQPGEAKVWNNLGCTLQVLGRDEEAMDAFRRAIGEQPDYCIAYKNLAGALREVGRLGEALHAYEQAQRFLPQDPAISHYLGALRHAPPERASTAYVKEMFDAFAKDFDRTLIDGLRYQTPQLLIQAIRGALSEPLPLMRSLDMGCGSGLFGMHARAISRELVGVDLSAEMIGKARERGCYDRLEEADLPGFLEKKPPGSFDLVAAADVFIYFGDLSEIFARTRTVLAVGGIFAYSVEADFEPGRDFRLRPTGRYCHARRYLEDLARQHGFTQVSFSQAVLRTEKGAGVQGYICVLRRTA